MYYAGDGLFCYSHDILNMTHVGQTMRDMEWKPEVRLNRPPTKPNRDVSLPAAWAHAQHSRSGAVAHTHELDRSVRPGAQEDVREADARWALTVATAQSIKAVTFISW